jgi:phasin family protein
MFPMNLFQAAGFPFSNIGLSKTWVSFVAPSFKIDTLFEMHRKNADAVVSANYVVLGGLNRLAQRQGELFAATVNDYTKVTRDVFARASLEEKSSSQVGAVRDVYASSVASLRELSDIAVNTNVTIAEILTTRVREAVDEFGALLGKPVATTASSVAATAVVAEPVGSVEEAPVSIEATLVEAVPTISPSAKTEPKKAMPPAKHGRRPTSRG